MIELISIQRIKKPHSSLSNRDSLTPQEKNNRFPFLDILGYLKIPTKIPNLEEWDKSQSGNLVGNSLVGTCLTLPNLGFLWVFFKYPKISKNGNPLFFPVCKANQYLLPIPVSSYVCAGYSRCFDLLLYSSAGRCCCFYCCCFWFNLKYRNATVFIQ